MSGRRSAERRGQAAEKNDAVRAKVAAVVVVLALLLLAACAASVWLKGGDDAPGEAPAAAGAGTASDDEVDELAGAAEEAVSEEPSTGAAATGSSPAAAPSGSSSAGGSASSPAQRPSSDGASAGNGSGSQPAAKPSHEHSWNAVTEQRWVVDQAAWDEDVYKTNIVCSCGLTWPSTAAWDDHNKQLMLNGGGCRHQSKPIYVETIHHEEVGHYETVTTGHRCSCGATK